MIKIPGFVLYDGLPVEFKTTPRGGLQVLVFDPKEQKFEGDSRYYSKISRADDDLVQEVDQKAFAQRVKQIMVKFSPKPLRRQHKTKGYSVLTH